MTTLDQPIAPTDAEREMARESGRLLSPFRSEGINATVRLDNGVSVPLPPSAVRLLARLLLEMGQGHAVGVVPMDSELSTQESAELLGVSRPFLVKLLETGQLPFRLVGTHRRVRLCDVVAYKHKTDAARNDALDELTRQAQELKLGY